MGTIEKRFLQVVVCVSLLLVHISFISLDVNIYQYSFLSYVITFIALVVVGAIVFSNIENTMKSVGNKLLLKKYQKILSSFSFWAMFLMFTALLFIDAYALGQLFMPADQVTKLFLPDLNEWFIYLPFSIAATIAIVHFLKSTITVQTN